MSNSTLISYTNISPNRNSPRNKPIDTITIHCMAGQMSAKSCADMFSVKENRVSANYCIGFDGKIALSCPEADRSWCTSSGENDHRAITIEVASDPTPPYKVKDAAYNSLIELVTDVCRRNGIIKLVWSDKKNDRVNHLCGCNMTVHRDYANKACPGEYLYSRMRAIADEVNSRLGITTAAKKTTWRVRKTWVDAKSQVGAFTVLSNAKATADKYPGYSVYDADGNAVYTSVSYTVYTVKTGDTLWGIAADKLGNGTRYTEIKTLNNLKTDVLTTGQKLKIPVK